MPPLKVKALFIKGFLVVLALSLFLNRFNTDRQQFLTSLVQQQSSVIYSLCSSNDNDSTGIFTTTNSNQTTTDYPDKTTTTTTTKAKATTKTMSVLEEIHKLSGGSNEDMDTLNCTKPLVPFQNRLVLPAAGSNDTRSEQQPLIPRILHVSMKSRCLPRDLSRTMERWKTQLPNHSIFFHDDDAVQKLLQEEWPEFPGLHRALQCILSKGAMLIDVWRVLVLWKYGGIYTDIDIWPEDTFTEDVIPANVSAFFFHDPFNRPSQWFMALEPRHPIMYESMMIILHNIMDIRNLRKPSVVQVTGPGAVKNGYAAFFPHMWQEGVDAVFQNNQFMIGKYGKVVYKLFNGQYHIGEHLYVTNKKDYHHIVPFNETLNVTRKERIEMESGVFHWQKVEHHLAKERVIPKISCRKYLELLDKK